MEEDLLAVFSSDETEPPFPNDPLYIPFQLLPPFQNKNPAMLLSKLAGLQA
jgi:hypothetical protein